GRAGSAPAPAPSRASSRTHGFARAPPAPARWAGHRHAAAPGASPARTRTTRSMQPPGTQRALSIFARRPRRPLRLMGSSGARLEAGFVVRQALVLVVREGAEHQIPQRAGDAVAHRRRLEVMHQVI